VEVRGPDRAWRHHVHRDAAGRELERPGARHAEDARLGRRVGGAGRHAERRARGDEHDPAVGRFLHRRERRLRQRDGGAEVKVGERGQIGELHVLEEGRADRPGVVDQRGDRVVARNLGCGLQGGLGVREIHLDVSHLQGGGMKIEGNHLVVRS